LFLRHEYCFTSANAITENRTVLILSRQDHEIVHRRQVSS